jgi:tetratricopeptide (TPR) repeat protein
MIHFELGSNPDYFFEEQNVLRLSRKDGEQKYDNALADSPRFWKLSLLALCSVLSSCGAAQPQWYKNLETARQLCLLDRIDQSDSLLRETKKQSTKGGVCPERYQDSKQVVTSFTGELSSLADCWAVHGRYQEAEALCHEALGIARSHADRTSVLAPLRALAKIFEMQKKFAQAQTIRVDIVKMPGATLDDFYRLGDSYLAEGKLVSAKAVYEKAIAEETKLPIKSPMLGDHLNKLGRCVFLEGDYDQAEKLYKQALNYEPTSLENERGDGYLAKDLRPIAELYVAKGEYEKAEPFYRHSLSGSLNYLPAEQVVILRAYAAVLRKLNRLKEAELREQQAKAKEHAIARLPSEPQYYE